MRCWNDSSSCVLHTGYGWEVLQGRQHQSNRPGDAMRSDRHRIASRCRSGQSRGLPSQLVYYTIDNQHVIHTVATIVAASTALVGVVVIGIAFYGCCQRGVLGMGSDSARTRSADGTTLVSTINGSFE
jgi:hypothetical protein